MKVYKDSVYSYVTIVEVKKSELEKVDLAVCKQPKETLSEFYNRQTVKPDVLTNAGFFVLKTGDTIFNLIDESKTMSVDGRYVMGIGIESDHKTVKYCAYNDAVGKCVDFVTAYPPLVDNYKSCAPWKFATELNYNATRTMVGYNDDTIYIVSVDAPGLKYDAMAELMIRIGCRYACNLDGGGSVRCMVGGEVANNPKVNRAVDSVLALYLTDAAKQNFYGPAESDEYYLYTIKYGDTWWGIATKETGSGKNYTKLQQYNNWPASKALGVGEQIKIPYSMNPNATPPEPKPPEGDTDEEDHSQIPQLDLEPSVQTKKILGSFVYDVKNNRYQIINNNDEVIAEFSDKFLQN